MKADFGTGTNSNTTLVSSDGSGLSIDLRKAEESGVKEVSVMTRNEIEEYTKNYKMQLRSNPDVLKIVEELDVTSMNEILAFGEKPAELISTVSDDVLHNTQLVKSEEVGEIMTSLTKIMSQFDLKDFEDPTEEKKGWIATMKKKVTKAISKTIDELIQKYDTMGSEVEKVYITLKKYENDIMNMSEKQTQLGNANVQYYRELEKHIVAGEMCIEELNEKWIPEFEKRAQESNDNIDHQNLNKLMQARDMLNTRVYDLQLAENVALQNLIMIQQAQQGNFMLVRTIKSEFIVTLPVFKQGLTQAIMLKRQALIARNVEAVRKTTDELIVKTAQNSATQSVMMANMATSGAVSIDKLKESYDIIKKGQDEANEIIKTNIEKMEKDREILKQYKYEMISQQRHF